MKMLPNPDTRKGKAPDVCLQGKQTPGWGGAEGLALPKLFQARGLALHAPPPRGLLTDPHIPLGRPLEKRFG